MNEFEEQLSNFYLRCLEFVFLCSSRNKLHWHCSRRLCNDGFNRRKSERGGRNHRPGATHCKCFQGPAIYRTKLTEQTPEHAQKEGSTSALSDDQQRTRTPPDTAESLSSTSSKSETVAPQHHDLLANVDRHIAGCQ